LLGIDIDVAALLLRTAWAAGFDNIADVLTLSPALMEGYVRAASKISRIAIGDLHAAPTVATFTMPRTASQMRHVEGTPFGTRGGISVVYNFPADGDYTFRIEPFDDSNGLLVGAKAEGEQVEVFDQWRARRVAGHRSEDDGHQAAEFSSRAVLSVFKPVRSEWPLPLLSTTPEPSTTLIAPIEQKPHPTPNSHTHPVRHHRPA